MNEVEDDFVDMLDTLGHEGCDFLVVGGHALAAHGAPRATGDIDILVRADAENARRVVAALKRFGAPLAAPGVEESDSQSLELSTS